MSSNAPKPEHVELATAQSQLSQAPSMEANGQRGSSQMNGSSHEPLGILKTARSYTALDMPTTTGSLPPTQSRQRKERDAIRSTAQVAVRKAVKAGNRRVFEVRRWMRLHATQVVIFVLCLACVALIIFLSSGDNPDLPDLHDLRDVQGLHDLKNPRDAQDADVLPDGHDFHDPNDVHDENHIPDDERDIRDEDIDNQDEHKAPSRYSLDEQDIMGNKRLTGGHGDDIFLPHVRVNPALRMKADTDSPADADDGDEINANVKAMENGDLHIDPDDGSLDNIRSNAGSDAHHHAHHDHSHHPHNSARDYPHPHHHHHHHQQGADNINEAAMLRELGEDDADADSVVSRHLHRHHQPLPHGHSRHERSEHAHI